MSFFVTSVGSSSGGDLGGIQGADQHCQQLARAVGSGTRTWRAYLSTTGSGGVNARDRIGSGPWYNGNGLMVASSVADLQAEDNSVSKETALNERGEQVNGLGDTPNRHDLLTGSNLDGTASDMTCENWTSDTSGSAMLGHHDRTGRGGASPWNRAHGSRGCSQEDLIATGGDGLSACFAVD